MRRVLFPVLGVVVVLGLLSRVHAADADVKAVLEKAIKAHGGEEALTKYKASQAKNKGKIILPMFGETEFTQEISSMLPDKLKEKMEFEINNVKIAVVTTINGDKISIEANGNNVPVNDNIKMALADGRQLLRASRLISLMKDKDFELSSAGEVKVEGKPAVGVLVKSKGQKTSPCSSTRRRASSPRWSGAPPTRTQAMKSLRNGSSRNTTSRTRKAFLCPKRSWSSATARSSWKRRSSRPNLWRNSTTANSPSPDGGSCQASGRG